MKFLGCLLFSLFSSAYAAELHGSIVSIHDGDTITVQVDRQRIKVRLVDIDAPESKQPFGQQSRQALSALCSGNPVRIETKSKDRYGRSLAGVTCGTTYVNAELVRQGMAWVYDKYVQDRSLYQLQDEARSAKRGLWADPNSIAPWQWRATKARWSSKPMTT